MAAEVKERISSNEKGKDDDINSEGSSTEKVKKKKERKEKKQKNKKKGSSALVPILILLLIIGAIAAVIYFDLFGVRTNYLSGVLSKIPIVNNLLPPEETTVSEDGTPSLTIDQLNAKIAELTAQNEAYTSQISEQNEKMNVFVEEINRLREYEDQQLQFKRDKADFDEMIANNDPNAFSKFYEQVNPELADEVYRAWYADNQKSKELKELVEDFTEMSAQEAADILTEMIRTELNMVVLVIKNLDSEFSGPILAKMTPKNAATVIKRMAP